jgi:hypothetical protein
VSDHGIGGEEGGGADLAAGVQGLTAGLNFAQARSRRWRCRRGEPLHWRRLTGAIRCGFRLQSNQLSGLY